MTRCCGNFPTLICCSVAARARFFFNPWLQLALEALLVTAAETFLKLGAAQTSTGGATEWLGLAGLTNSWVWIGILFFAASFICWANVLRALPLSLAYPLSNVVYILVPISSRLFLGEHVSAKRWCGVAIVVCGLALVAKPVAQLEEKL